LYLPLLGLYHLEQQTPEGCEKTLVLASLQIHDVGASPFTTIAQSRFPGGKRFVYQRSECLYRHKEGTATGGTFVLKEVVGCLDIIAIE
jgi:hypothetical protein